MVVQYSYLDAWAARRASLASREDLAIESLPCLAASIFAMPHHGVVGIAGTRTLQTTQIEPDKACAQGYLVRASVYIRSTAHVRRDFLCTPDQNEVSAHRAS